MQAKWRAGAALAVVLSAGGPAGAFYFEGWPGSGLRPAAALVPQAQSQDQTPGTQTPDTQPSVVAPNGPTPGGPPGPIDMPPVGPIHTPEPATGLIGLIGLGALGLRRLRKK
jgi:MYXO-CTERM domain-containing protein